MEELRSYIDKKLKGAVSRGRKEISEGDRVAWVLLNVYTDYFYSSLEVIDEKVIDDILRGVHG